jgi:hypothetical protein
VVSAFSLSFLVPNIKIEYNYIKTFTMTKSFLFQLNTVQIKQPLEIQVKHPFIRIVDSIVCIWDRIGLSLTPYDMIKLDNLDIIVFLVVSAVSLISLN